MSIGAKISCLMKKRGQKISWHGPFQMNQKITKIFHLAKTQPLYKQELQQGMFILTAHNDDNLIPTTYLHTSNIIYTDVSPLFNSVNSRYLFKLWCHKPWKQGLSTLHKYYVYVVCGFQGLTRFGHTRTQLIIRLLSVHYILCTIFISLWDGQWGAL